MGKHEDQDVNIKPQDQDCGLFFFFVYFHVHVGHVFFSLVGLFSLEFVERR